MGVDRELAAELDVAVAHEVRGLTAPAEAELLELYQHERREVVVDHGRLDVARAQPRRLVQLPSHQAHLGQPGDLVGVVAGHHLLPIARALRGGADHRRRLAQVARPLEARHHDRHRAIALLAAVQQPQRLDDPTRALVVLQRDRLLVEPGVRVRGGVLAVGHRDSTEVLGGGAVLVHVAPRGHRDPGRRSEQPEGCVPAEVGALGRRLRPAVLHARAEAAPRALVHRAVAHHHVGDAGGDGQRRLLHGGARGAPPVVDPAEEGQLPSPEAAGDLDLGVVVHAEGGHAVDVFGC